MPPDLNPYDDFDDDFDGDNGFYQPESDLSGSNNRVSNNGSNLTDHLRDRARNRGDKAGKTGNNLGKSTGKAGQSPGGLGERLGRKTGNLGRGIGKSAAETGRTTGRAVGEAGEAAGQVGKAAGKAAGQVASRAAVAATQAATQAVAAVFSNPVSAGIAIAVIVVLLIVILVLLLFLLGSGGVPGVSYNATATEATGRIGFSSIHVRRSLLRAEALFTSPADCGEPVYCKLTPGVSAEEIKKMRNVGLTIDEADIVPVGDKFYLKRLQYSNLSKEMFSVDKTTFPEKFRTDAVLMTPLEQITSSGSIFWRSPRALERFALYGINRDDFFNQEVDTSHVDELIPQFRGYVFTRSGTYQDPPENFKEDVDNEAQKVSSAKMGGVPETAIANTTGFDTKNNNDKILELINADTAKKGVYNKFKELEEKEQACTFADLIDANNLNIKTTKQRALAKYGGLFVTMADAQRSQATTAAHVSLVERIRAAKSIAYDSYDKVSGQSEGYLLMNQGKIDDGLGTGGVARFATGGNPSLLYLNQVLGNLNSATPVDDADAVYTTSDLIAYRSGGCDKFYERIKGNLTPEKKEIMSLLVAQYLFPQFVLNKAAAIAPDPVTDPEKGYGAGNALAGGFGALTSAVARNLGLEAMKYENIDQLVEESNRSTYLPGYTGNEEVYGREEATPKEEKVNNYINYLCNDRTISGEGIAADIYCNILWGYTKDVLLADQYSPRNVIKTLRFERDWPIGSPCYHDGLINVNPLIQGPDGYNDPGVEQSVACIKAKQEGEDTVPHIDENGTIATQRYQDYITNCIASDKAIIDQDKYGELQYGSDSAAYCATNGEAIFRYFRMFVFDTNILDAEQQSINGTLGQSAGSVAAAAAQNSGGTANVGNASLNGLDPNTLPMPPGSGQSSWTDATADTAKLLWALFGQYYSSFSTRTSGGAYSKSCHYSGNAIDMMIKDYKDPNVQAQQRAIAEFIMQNREALNVTNIIYYDKSFNTWSNSSDKPYSQWSSYSNPGGKDDTSAHRDHIHLSIAPCKH